MIIVSSPLKRDFFKEYVSELKMGEDTFTFEKETGIKLYFSTTAEDKEAAVRFLKDTLRKTELGRALYFIVELEK